MDAKTVITGLITVLIMIGAWFFSSFLELADMEDLRQLKVDLHENPPILKKYTNLLADVEDLKTHETEYRRDDKEFRKEVRHGLSQIIERLIKLESKVTHIQESQQSLIRSSDRLGEHTPLSSAFLPVEDDPRSYVIESLIPP